MGRNPVTSLVRDVRASMPRIAWWTVCVCLAVLFAYPVVAMILQSVKSPAEASASPPTLLPHSFTLENYRALGGGGTGIDVLPHLLNSVVVSVAVTVLTVLLATLAGYGFARLRFPGSNAIFFSILVTFMIPFQAIITPLFVVLHRLGLTNSLVGLVLVNVTLQLPFGIFLMRNSFGAVPMELEEAGMLDGCSLAGVMARVMLPVALPGIVTTALFAFFAAWNDFFGALILLTDQSKFTLPVTLSILQSGQFGSINWGLLEAGVFVTILPPVVVFLLLRRYYVGGLLSGAVK